VSDSKNRPGGPPPDDFSKTTPNINLPDDSEGQSDWNKTNYNMPKQPASDDWGKTVANIKPIDTSGQDFDKTYFPGSKGPSTPEWGVTNARVDTGGADFGTNPEDFGGSSQGYDKTTPYFKLPEAERAKYQSLPPTPTEQAAQDEKEQQEKGGLPGWFWVLAGLVVMFLFAVVILGVAYFIIPSGSGYEATLKGAPPGSSVWVDGSAWGTTDADGNIKLTNLKGGGSRKIEIKNQLWDCQPMDVRSDTRQPLIAQCKQKAAITTQLPLNPQCSEFKPGEVDKSVQCFNQELDNLDPDSFTVQQLIHAMNLLIINFASGKSDIPPERMKNLERASGYIIKLQKRDLSIVLEVGGHTDNVGTDAKNQPLSEHRADAVKKALVGLGVNASGLQTRGYGSSKPKFDNTTEQNRFMNRRIEYSIVAK
jgi:outer membrane protein OmpA-like peptidoglycan-associated protein